MQPKQIRKSNISNLTNGLLLPVPFTFPGIHSAKVGGLVTRRFYKPCPISRSKIILSNPHLLIITRSRIKLIGHFSFCNKFAVYTCHESVCIFLKRDCHLREKDHHRDHWCNYIPVLTTIEDWHTRAYCHGPSKCLLLNMNSVIISTQ